MNPIEKYVKNLFAKKRTVGDGSDLTGLAKADMVLNNLVNDKKIPGVSITVLKDGNTLLQKGYGHADIENRTPVDPAKTIFRIASVSKPIAATALAHMVADGNIDLDASFYDYVPYYPQKKWDFTIRQLAGHTAGIRSYRGVEYGLNHPYTIKQSIAIFKDDDLVFQPGKGYLYTSYDWVLLSLAIQEVSGMPFEDYVQQKVLSPLGMQNTTVPLISKNSEQHTNISTFYSKNRSGFRKAIPVHNKYKLAGGGYLSTSADIARFGQTYLDGAILTKEIRTQFLTSRTVNGKSTYYGLGWQVSEDAKGRKFYGHVGNGVGGYSNFFVYPEERMVFVLLVNCTDAKVQGELDKVVDTLISAQKFQSKGINS